MTTQSQLAAMRKFAELHDWGTRAYIPMYSQALHVWDDCENQILIFTDMQSLKAWAGY